jgi:hypothetical protein
MNVLQKIPSLNTQLANSKLSTPTEKIRSKYIYIILGTMVLVGYTVIPFGLYHSHIGLMTVKDSFVAVHYP